MCKCDASNELVGFEVRHRRAGVDTARGTERNKSERKGSARDAADIFQVQTTFENIRKQKKCSGAIHLYPDS